MCPACGIELNPEWTHCPHCRAFLNSEPGPLQPPEPVAEAATLEISDVNEPPKMVSAPPAKSKQPAPAIAPAAQQSEPTPSPAQTSVVETPPGGPIGQLPGQLTDILVPDGRFRVLIVDDDIVTCNLITLLMRRFDFQTSAVIANDGEQAFKKIEEEAPTSSSSTFSCPEWMATNSWPSSGRISRPHLFLH
jgi:CheY-like chemotaxis protein